jgi:hypothetical protein
MSFKQTAKSAGFAERWRILLLGTLLVLTMLWPAAVNRGVFIFPDTTAYVRSADAAFVKMTGTRSDWSDQLFTRYAKATRMAPKTAAGSPTTEPSNEVVLAGRSVYYGLFLFVVDALGSFWAVAVAQAMLVVVAMILAVWRVTGTRSSRALVPLLALPFITSVAFFTDFMMPDILNPLAMIATVMIGIYWRAMPRNERLFWFALLLFGLVAHSANILIVAAVVVAMSIAKLMPRSGPVVLMPLFIVLGLAVLAEVVFSLGVAELTGHPPVRPPFVSARIIDDGPGHAYLRQECQSGNRFALCKYLARMPSHSDDMLWSQSPVGGIFSTVNAEEKRRIAADEPSFVLGVVADRPVDVAISTAQSIMRQAEAFGMAEFNGQHVDSSRLPLRIRASYMSTRAVAGTFDFRMLEMVFLATFLLSATYILFAVAREIRAGAVKDETRLAILIAMGLAVNIAVAGAMSTPHDRYQARAAWLLPLAAVLVVMADQMRRRQPADWTPRSLA